MIMTKISSQYSKIKVVTTFFTMRGQALEILLIEVTKLEYFLKVPKKPPQIVNMNSVLLLKK